MMPSRNRRITFAIFGIIFILFGTFLSIFLPMLYERLVHKELAITPTSTSFGMWKDTESIPFYLDVYFFNWTNPEDIRTPGIKPKFDELGPYSFLERKKKVNIVFHPENNTVSYDLERTWVFTPERSNGSLNDSITQLNVIALSAAHAVRYWTYFWQTGLAVVLSKLDDIYLTKTVDELLFAGYEDPLIKMGQLTQMIELPPFDKFGWFYMRNGSLDFEGHYNIGTGQDDLKNIGIIRNWNYGNITKFYKTPCNAIEGSAGEFWPARKSFEDISLYSVDICRSLFYEYEKNVSLHGITGYQYSIGEKTLSNSTRRNYPHEKAKYFDKFISSSTFEETVEEEGEEEAADRYDRFNRTDSVNVGQCFCNGDCLPSGVINVTACRYGAPAFVSLPHFHKADPYYGNMIEGMKPDDSKHGFRITLEPATGIPINVEARLQVNVLLKPMSFSSLYADVPEVFFPMFWFNQEVALTEDVAFLMRLFLQLPSIGFYFSVGIAFLGAVFLLTAGISQLTENRRNFSAMNMKHCDIASPPPAGQKSELIYLDTTTKPDDDDGTRKNRKLYPTLVNEKEDL